MYKSPDTAMSLPSSVRPTLMFGNALQAAGRWRAVPRGACWASLLFLIFLTVPGHTDELSQGKAAEAQSAERTKQEIAEWVRRLGHREYRMRERAERELRNFGLLALEQLQAAEQDEDVEIRLRSRYLIAELRGRMISEVVPPELKNEMEGYERREFRVRQALLNKVIHASAENKLALLARLARFEESDLLAREAALAILSTDLDAGGGWEANQRDIAMAIGFNERMPVQWIRAYSASYQQLDEATDLLAKYIADELAFFETSSGRTNASVVDRLKRIHIDLLLKGDHQEAAYRAMAELDPGTTPTTALLLVDWMMERQAWPAVTLLAEKRVDRFAADALLTYRLAEAILSSGDAAAAQEVAAKGFDLAGAGIAAHLRSYQGIFYRLGLNEPLINESRKVVTRLAMASLLEDDRGMFDWAEREYRAAIREPIRDEVELAVYESLAAMLHDRQRDGQAAEVLQQLMRQVDTLPSVKSIVAAEVPPGDTSDEVRLRSQMHFYAGQAAAENQDSEKAMEELLQGMQVQRRNADLLIAMYRVPDPTPAFRKTTLQAIQEVTQQISDELTAKRTEIDESPNDADRRMLEFDVAHLENEFAWLVGNTEGDIDEAIRCSLHSLEIRSDDFGLQDTLARCYYRKGELELAVQYQTMAAAAAPHEGQIVRQLELFEQALREKQSSP